MEFLYFPEDKTEYIPAVLWLLFFMFLAFLTFYFIRKASRKEEQRLLQLEEKQGNNE
jgi:flagellar biosynthesis/type III secretory pathway M-ring protein FliF/YscJ